MQKYRYINHAKFKNHLYNMLYACTFHVRHKSLCACYAHVSEYAHNFLRLAPKEVVNVYAVSDFFVMLLDLSSFSNLVTNIY